ncbi:hypothetical protein K525DRAFT_185266 [Schizophyllum commune Loenen D]|nr:hypothetical protein K525DRAFT_185266 [Schizophyllum commune Loenen D]
MGRFLREGNSLSILTSICLALLSEMYTTTYVPKDTSPDGKPQPRIRLKYRSSPIADFGIAKGSADVKTQDRFAYFSAPDLRFWMGADPNEHYWLWFRTIRGEEVTLDLDMFTFNMCMLVPTAPYRNAHCPPSELMQYAPAYLYEREFQKHVISLTQERSRASVLRDPALQRAIRTSVNAIGGEDVRAIHQWMERLAGKQIPRTEVDLMMKWTINNLELLGATLANREWTRFPEQPSFAIDADPGEMDNEPGEADSDWYEFAAKWTKKYKKGKISREALDKAHREWKSHVMTKPSR